MQAVVVDPGGDVDRILAAIKQAGVSVERIWLTHGHLDHAGGADELREALGNVPIEGPDQRDEFLLQGLEEQGRAYGFAMRNVTPDLWLVEGDSVAFGEHRFDVLHCPGHTPGHVVFVNRAARFALVGDVLFQGSVGRTDFPYGDHAALIPPSPRSSCRWAMTSRSCAGTARDRPSARSGGATRSFGRTMGFALRYPSYSTVTWHREKRRMGRARAKPIKASRPQCASTALLAGFASSRVSGRARKKHPAISSSTSL